MEDARTVEEKAAVALRELRRYVNLAERPAEDFERLRALLLGEPFKLHSGETVPTLVASILRWLSWVDPKAIRDVADKAREMSAMLSPELSETVSEAIKAARSAARQIVKRVEKGGEEAAVVLADIQRGNIEKARLAFLDLSDEVEPAPVSRVLPAVAVQRFADLADAEPVAEVV